MKKLMIGFILTLLMCGPSMAETYSHGSAIVPMVETWYRSSVSFHGSQIHLSNITESDVECSVRFYDHDGNEIGSQANIYKGSQTASAGILESTGSTFTLRANNSRFIEFYNTSLRMLTGYAVIEWECSNPKVSKAVVAGLLHFTRAGSGTYSSAITLINNGQPF